MNNKKGLISAAIELANEQKEKPVKCSQCKGVGEVKGTFGGSVWDCFHCDGTGYVGNSTSIAKWFRQVLIKRTQQIRTMHKQYKTLEAESDRIKRLFPDWEEAYKKDVEAEFIEANRSRFD